MTQQHSTSSLRRCSTSAHQCPATITRPSCHIIITGHATINLEKTGLHWGDIQQLPRKSIRSKHLAQHMKAPRCPALERCSSLQKETRLGCKTHSSHVQQLEASITSNGGADGDIPRLGFSLQGWAGLHADYTLQHYVQQHTVESHG
ncbi:hypothetical protein V8G54_011750 [Vigna mungo]|uniref:Uncharacterized protein n=1 Tax=Vigna mungo TaxID=3915 RepID=A0AAQ3RZW7_VIGMU